MPHRPRSSQSGVGGLLVVFLLLSHLSVHATTSAQQQRLPHHDPQFHLSSDLLESAWLQSSQPGHGESHHSMINSHDPQKRSKSTSTNPHNPQYHPSHVRALATLAPAQDGDNPAAPAVRAPPASRSAGSPTGGLSSRRTARFLRDWEVEDLVLLATVDGTLHARDRRRGTPRWVLEADRPMVETVYHNHSATPDSDPREHEDFLWIVEPSQDGALYGYTPGSDLGMQKIGLTVKQLVDLSPYAADEPPVVYSIEKKTTLYTVDVGTGNIMKIFSAGGAPITDQASCRPINQLEPSDEKECGAYGSLTLGRIEYTIVIQSRETQNRICTIRYFEWSPNVRDKDLYDQYVNAKDNRYIYSLHDGRILAMEYFQNQNQQSPSDPQAIFQQKLGSPVVRVFDVARSIHDTSPNPPLIILPQPLGPVPGQSPEKDRIFVNCTESGSWYALSENQYPLVTSNAGKALSSLDGWGNSVPRLGDPGDSLLKDALVGVHALSYQDNFLPDLPQITSGDEPVELGGPDHVQNGTGPLTLPSPTNAWRERSVVTSSFIGVLILALVYAASIKAWPKIPQQLVTFSPRSDVPRIDVSPAPLPEGVPQEDDKISKKEITVKTVSFKEPEKRDEFPVVTPSEPLENVDQSEANDPQQESAPNKKKKAHRGKRGGKGVKDKTNRNRSTSNPDQGIPAPLNDAAKDLGKDVIIEPDVVSPLPQQETGPSSIGNLLIHTNNELGRGSGGTFVFEGEFQGRKVAVKRMLSQHVELAEQEVTLLEDNQGHPNVIRYFCRQQDSNFLYIALELCQASLWDIYRDSRHDEAPAEKFTGLSEKILADPKRVLRQLAEGMKQLHRFRVVHRDIKPQNILVAYPRRLDPDPFPRLVISDFGLCKMLPENASTLIGTTGNAGTAGWKAPELISQPKDSINGSQHSAGRDSDSISPGMTNGAQGSGVKRASDIFSLGCVFFYVLTRGSHPFDDDEGWMALRERNIKTGRANFKELELLGADTEDLIRWMLSPLPEDRPTAAQLLAHPFFWDTEDRLEFLSAASDRFDQEIRDPPSNVLNALESHAAEVIPRLRSEGSRSYANVATHGHLRNDYSQSHTNGTASLNSYIIPSKSSIPPPPNFLAHLDKPFVESLGRQRKYNPSLLADLLRALRNKYRHKENLAEDLKDRDGYMRYWDAKFPSLVVAVWRVAAFESSLGLETEMDRWFGRKGS